MLRIASTRSASPCKGSRVTPIRSRSRPPWRPSIPRTTPSRASSARLGRRRARRSRSLPRQPGGIRGIRERFLPEIEFRGRIEHHKSHYALQAAAMIHGGVEQDLLGEVTWWHRDDLWLWSLYALVIHLRVAAERTGTSVGVVCQSVATRHGVDVIPDG